MMFPIRLSYQFCFTLVHSILIFSINSAIAQQVPSINADLAKSGEKNLTCAAERPLSSLSEPPRDRHDPIPPPLKGMQPETILDHSGGEISSIAVQRNKLRDCYGILFGSKYIGEVLGNTTGGQRTGAIYEGKYRMSLDIDFEKLASVDNFILHASGSQLHGKGIAAYNVNAIMPPSNIEATPSSRLYELWFQKGLLNDFVNIRIGQLGSDQEFMYPQWGVIFLNNTFG